MKVIWSGPAAEDLREIVSYIAADSPEAARRVAKHIYDKVNSLRLLPERGRRRKEDTSLELVFAPWPYIAVYEVVGQRVYIKAIQHTSRERAH